jgi:hypothetical protein
MLRGEQEQGESAHVSSPGCGDDSQDCTKVALTWPKGETIAMLAAYKLMIIN